MDITPYLPTAVESISVDFWVKRDDLTHPVYGGNKVRKLAHLLPRARELGKTRVLTAGAAGSHHVLCTAVHAREAGLTAAAVMTPQPYTEHAADNLRAGLAKGLTVYSAESYPGAMLRTVRERRADDLLVPVGGSDVVGSRGYMDAAFELEQQIRAGLCPKPKVLAVTLGSGGTVAGLLVGLARAGLHIQLDAVLVAEHEFAIVTNVEHLVRALARTSAEAELALSLMHIVRSELGDGYAQPTERGREAYAQAATGGAFKLDLTYTAKTYAHARDVAAQHIGPVLYWHTLSSSNMAPLLEGAISREEVVKTYPELWTDLPENIAI